MKKFAKISLITAAVMFVLGWGLLITGGVMGGVTLIKEFAVHGFSYLRKGLFEIVESVPLDLIPEEVNINYNEAYPTIQGENVSNMQICGRDEVTDMKIYMMSGELSVKNCTTDDFGVDWEGVGKFQYYVEDGTLYVISTENFGNVTLYVPVDMNFESCTLAAAASNVDIDTIKAGDVSMYFGASEVSIDLLEADGFTLESGKSSFEIAKGTIGDCVIEYDTGDIGYSGSILGNAEVTGSMGNLEMELWGDSDQFNYFIHSSMGSVDMPGYDVVGWTQNKIIDNSAGKDMTINSSMGNIEINFMVE